MTTIQQIKESVTEGWDEQVGNMCVRIIDRLSELSPAQTKRLTYNILAKIVNKEPTDEKLQTALTVLTSVEHHPLVMEFVFLDEYEDRELVISAQDVFQSLDEGEFIHPRTGVAVPHFEKKLRPIFRPTEEFMEVAAR